MPDQPPRGVALITGATAGLGAAFAARLAAERWDLTLVARDAERLSASAAELRARHGVRVSVLPADLATESGTAAVEDRLRDATEPVELLVNNAGIGLNKAFHGSTLDDELRILRLNVEAVMRLTFAVLPQMTERRSGGVINVSSVSGYGVTAPGSTYTATKAYVINFSESIAQSVRRYGVRVLALCPGFVRTEFHQRAGIPTAGSPGWIWLDAGTVAAKALADLRKGRYVSVPSVRYKIAASALRHTPHGLVRRFSEAGNRFVGRGAR
ncbi:short-subunit dehydrogenase [Catenuloplanes nepalensis]|uniref:Short-subunit dehydrogenase n=1 Tax=Catenuloplanes nepalensis TaxID=587533 RepID=A0ABT9N3W0_9ACTN|nr:SDR family oxidoreductase [Catenuloplanes nepalensis]MDP9798383.1 short-subunit dehydrogenase [Catenuloplanes nepalensis]